MKRYGLFVGVDQYRDGISSLTCSCNDAQTLSYVFARESFDEVKYLDNDKANSEKVMDEVERMVDELAAGDLFVFYFAGHGREVNGEHFLVGPTGRPQPDLYRRGTVSIPELLTISNKQDLNRVFILDCCRSNLIAGRGEAFACPRARDLSLQSAMDSIPNVMGLPPLIINSCSTGQQAFELQEQGHGVFTQALLDVLNEPITDFENLLKELDVKIQNFIPVLGTR